VSTTRGAHFRFGSVFIKKITKPNFFKKKIKTGSNRPVSVRFGFLGKKPVQIGLARFSQFCLNFFRFWLFFPGLARFWLSFFPVWLIFSGFFPGLGSVRFFLFFGYKTETEPNRPVFSKF